MLEQRDKQAAQNPDGWLVNRNVVMLLPADRDLFHPGQICPGNLPVWVHYGARAVSLWPFGLLGLG